ncbi:MAG: sigma-54 dependent transcriptional regulator [Desulfobacteraceae bacterium]|jgi:DNA-binding NtrC family response regulator|nr:sigma-54 dependent transcriptional regulator [Desulfobacteraceae bacterium]
MERKILVIDDEPDMLNLLKRSLEPDLKCAVETAASGEAALRALAGESFDLVLADIRMPGMDGLELLELVKRENPRQTVVMMTAFGRVEMAVEAMRRGAYDFITKPFEHDALLLRLGKALERSALVRENQRLLEKFSDGDDFEGMVGQSTAMQKVFQTIRMVAKTDLTVLITGESGTGKDLAGRAIHKLSSRCKCPFIAVNCPTVPENILESELFGYKKGAFTHATQNKTGLFEEAHTGTIFLDEIGDITPSIQTKLLRVLQEKEIKPLGSNKPIQVDVRIVASTNQHLSDKIGIGEFREDFFYRLNVLPIEMPALRERQGDIPLLAGHMLQKHRAKLKMPDKTFSPELLDLFTKYQWIGNVREMENMIIQGILFSSGSQIEPETVGLSELDPAPCVVNQAISELPYKEAKEETLRQFNAHYIGSLLTQTDGNVSQAARLCGIERQALQQIMRRYGISADPYRA